MDLILSLFPGIDLLGRGFELEGFFVVRGPELILGQSIENYHAPSGRFDGVIAGSPCQNFSGVNRNKNTAEGLRLIGEFIRIVNEAQPAWFLLENVPGVPDVEIPGYRVQRFFLNAKDCGLTQNRNRRFQYGTKTGELLIIQRLEPAPMHNNRESPEARILTADHKTDNANCECARSTKPLRSHNNRESAPGCNLELDNNKRERSITRLAREITIENCCLASEGAKKTRRSFADFCRLQGLPPGFDLRGWSTEMKYRFVGNAVALPVARTIARAVKESRSLAFADSQLRVCLCECGRVVNGRAITATAACRQRIKKLRSEGKLKPAEYYRRKTALQL